MVAVLEQTYRMNYETMIDAVVEDEAIEDSKTIQGIAPAHFVLPFIIRPL